VESTCVWRQNTIGGRWTRHAISFTKILKSTTTPWGTLLYYAIYLDPTLIIPVNVLASEQTRAIAVTADKIIKLLNTYSDASYLSEREAKSRAGGFF
jgi:hypothetical protein